MRVAILGFDERRDSGEAVPVWLAQVVRRGCDVLGGVECGGEVLRACVCVECLAVHSGGRIVVAGEVEVRRRRWTPPRRVVVHDDRISIGPFEDELIPCLVHLDRRFGAAV
jgi:hypothetical protein